MTINTDDYKLDTSNYIPQGTKKNKIVIGSTYSTKMKHIEGWKTRCNGNYTKTAMFTIGIRGEIYQHFSPNYFSDFMLNPDINETSITILLENEGWLTKDLSNENKYINYVGHIYNRKASIVEKRWRNQNYWAPFTNKQYDAAAELVVELSRGFNIPLDIIAHNTNFDEAPDFEGILYRSNFEKFYTDISPAWDCELFINKVEKKENNE